jgi:predicted phage terminase large subunit-like protein
MRSDEAVYAALLREDFYTYFKKVFATLNRGVELQESWHLRVMAYELEGVARGRTRRLILNLPPRSLKSIAASVALVTWYLGHNPSAEVICASYGQDLSIKFAQDRRAIMQTAWYQAIFPTRISASKSAAADFRTIQGGSCLATSVSGPMTGRGADLVVIDDPAKPDEMLSEVQRDGVNRWVYSTVHSRLNKKDAAGIVLTMQRLHVMDLTGYLAQDPAWKLLRLAAIADADEEYTIELVNGKRRTYRRHEGTVLQPERDSLESLQRTRETLGSYLFAAQYQQTPMAPDGNIVKVSWFPRYDEAPTGFERIFQSWDTASETGKKNSYSVCTTWGIKGKHVYLLHVFRKRLEYPDLKRAVAELSARFRPAVIIVEAKSSGAALVQELRRDNLYTLKEVKPQGSKEMRMSTQTAMMENGFVHLPKDAPWLPAYELELMLFPIGEHDDQADSTSQALAYFQEHLQEPGGLAFYRMECERLGIIVRGVD